MKEISASAGVLICIAAVGGFIIVAELVFGIGIISPIADAISSFLSNLR